MTGAMCSDWPASREMCAFALGPLCLRNSGPPAILAILSVVVRRIVLAQQMRQRAIEAVDSRRHDGFPQYARENGMRWTNGYAMVPAELFGGVSGRCVLMVDVAC